jgi:hypothetical protein
MNTVNTFTGARMNKDIDARLIPSTEYIDALNVDVINSTDGNKNGVLRNSKGNRRLETPTGTTIDVKTVAGAALTNPVVIGVCKYEPNNAIYWLIASDTEDIIVEYIDRPDTVSAVTAGLYGVVGDMTVILRAAKASPTTASLLGFNKNYLISGINYFNGFLLWTDNLSAPKMVNIADAKNWTATNFAWNIDDIIVIVKPPVSAPSLFLKNDTNIKTNTKNKFLYFSYRYKYANSRWSSMAPFSKVGFFPSAFAYDQNAEANVGMQNIYNSVDITVNTGSRQVTDIQILFRDTSSNNVYIIETINKAHPILQTSTIPNDSTFTYKSFDNNKIYTALPSRQLTRLFDNVPIKALAQDIIGGRLIYGNYTQFYDLKTDFNSLVLPNYTVSINSTTIATTAPPEPSLKTGRDYEIGLMYLDDYGRMSTVLTSPKNTIHLPYSKAGNKNSLILDIAHFPPKWATKYRVAIKQSKDSYYNIYPRVAYLDGTGTWFKISNSDVNKVAVGDYVIIKTLYTGVSGDSKEYKVLEISAKNFGEIVANSSLAGTYLKLNYTQAITNTGEYSFSTPTPIYNTMNPSAISGNNAVGSSWLVASTKTNIDSSPCVFYKANGTSFKGSLLSGATFTPVNSNPSSRDIRYIVEYAGIFSGNHCVNIRQFPSQTNINSVPVAFRNVSSGTVTSIPLTSSFQSGIIGYLYIDQTFTVQTGDSWRVNVYSKFLGQTIGGNGINRLGVVINTDTVKQEISGGTLIEFKRMYDGTIGSGTTAQTPPQSFIATKTYVDIQEWFWEDGAYLTFNHLYLNNTSLGYKNVFFRNALPNTSTITTPINGNRISAATSGTTNANVFMIISSGGAGVFSGSNNSTGNGSMSVDVKITYQKNVLCLETTPKDTDSKIFHECSEDFQIYQNGNNRCHTGDIQNQTAIQRARLTLPLTFNCFAFDNGVESNRIRDDFNAPTMEWSPRVNGVSEDYGQQVQSESLTYSGVYRADSNVNNLNEFNLSIGNFKNLEKSFGSIQKIKSRDNDLIVIHEDKITKVLFGKNLLSDSTGGGTVSSVPEVLGTQISYEGNYGISKDPMTFSEYAGDMWFSDVQRGVLLRLNNQGLFPISKNGMQSFFNTRFAADYSTKKIGGFDPVNKRYMYTDTSIKITKQPNTIIINSPVVDAMGSSLPNFLNNPVLSSSNNNPTP